MESSMAFGQIDPARLDGDALRQWYLRSPADIEDERQQAASQAYDAFFGRSDPNADGGDQGSNGVSQTSAPEDLGLDLFQVGPNRFRTGSPSGSMATPDMASGPNDSGYQLAAAVASAPGHFPIPGCVGCHGAQGGDLLPGNSPTPRPRILSPRDAGVGGHGGSEPDRRDKKECELQLDSDHRICGGLRYSQDVPICLATAMERYAYCRRPDGTIGHPHLETQ